METVVSPWIPLREAELAQAPPEPVMLSNRPAFAETRALWLADRARHLSSEGQRYDEAFEQASREARAHFGPPLRLDALQSLAGVQRGPRGYSVSGNLTQAPGTTHVFRGDGPRKPWLLSPGRNEIEKAIAYLQGRNSQWVTSTFDELFDAATALVRGELRE